MSQKIRVVIERTYVYTPALSDLEYSASGVTSIEQALAYDQKEYEAGELDLEELLIEEVVETATWSIIDE